VKLIVDLMYEEGKQHPIEAVSAELRAMMPFINAGKQKVAEGSGGDR
jgi:ketol-acid reductoisomerase|tara:strand:- start:7320 stop:7460 length:141 start_codon:yes stop_codon:yes gene_type:complete